MLRIRLYRERILFLVAVSVLSSLLLTFIAVQALLDNLFLNQLQSFYFMYDMTDALSVILQMIPFTIFIVSMSGIFKLGIKTELTYYFTREQNLKKWFFKKFFVLVVLSLLTLGVFQIVGIVFLYIYSGESAEALRNTFLPNFYVFLLAWLFVFTFSLLINMLSLYVPAKVLLPLFVFAIFLLGLHYVYEKTAGVYVSINPITHFFFKNHVEYLDYAPLEDATIVIPGLMTWHSVMFFLIIIAVITLIGYWKIKRTDLGLLLED